MSEGLCTAIPIMNLIDELKENRLGIQHGEAKLRCKVFEDNTGARLIASVPRIQPRTNIQTTSIGTLWSMFYKGGESIHPVKSEGQLADILTNPLPKQ